MDTSDLLVDKQHKMGEYVENTFFVVYPLEGQTSEKSGSEILEMEQNALFGTKGTTRDPYLMH